MGKKIKCEEKKGFRRLTLCVLVFLCAAWLFSVPVFGETFPEMPKEYGEVEESLPPQVREKLPRGLFSEDFEERERALGEMTSPPFWFDLLSQTASTALGDCFGLMATLCGLLLFVAVLRTVQDGIGNESLGRAVSFGSTAVLFASIVALLYRHIESVLLFFDRLHALMLSMLPVCGTILAMGGNVSTAATTSAGLSLFLTVSETLCAKTVIPVCSICTALILCRSLSPESGLSGIHNAIRKTYAFVLGLVMTLMTALLAAQSTLGAAADGVGARAARLVSSTVIPLVGGAVGETLRTVASGVRYLKSAVGIGGMLLLGILVLPTLLSLLCTRMTLLLCGGVAELLGCEKEGRMLSELGGVWGTMLAVVSMTSVMFLLSLVIFVRITVAAA